ncbi:murein hydrolase activator EnvC family protein [Massilia solisilvae]|uniref:murein hydrolase activator EnvC family protein n=1 Tax=Massilia solisilvae TaxID=1811225 RepID=UPI00351D315B
MRPSLKKSGSALLCALLALGCASLADARTTERAKQKAEAEARRAGIAQQLQALKKDISRTESEKEDAGDLLAESEEAISDANRALHDLAQEQEDTNARLQSIADEQARLARTIETQKQQLATLLRKHYVAGNEDRIKLLLSGDNPNRINRDLQMMSYVSQAQAKLLASLRANLAQVEANREKVENAKEDLEDIAQEQREQKARLEKEKARRANLLASLSSKLAGQRKQATKLERDEQRLSGLVDQLSRIIRQQEAAAAAERKRQEALAAARAKAEAEAKALAAARARAERERLAQQGKPGARPVPEPEPPKVVEQAPPPRSEPPPPRVVQPAAPEGAFASLKGKLAPPVAGKVETRFGAKRADGGPAWRGMFIKAAEGSEVRTVAAGRVMFASWMRSYGNLIIIDHGGQYLSIYANNQSLLKHVGDMVKPGEPIATAGNTGGNEESGLYFELRHLGAPFDPAGWVRF